MAKKVKKAKSKKAKKTKKVSSGKTAKGAKKVAAKQAAHSSSRNRSLMKMAASQPLHAIAAKHKLRMPLYACLRNGLGAKCSLMRYNPDTGQYDIEEGFIDCSRCEYILQPTQ